MLARRFHWWRVWSIEVSHSATLARYQLAALEGSRRQALCIIVARMALDRRAACARAFHRFTRRTERRAGSLDTELSAALGEVANLSAQLRAAHEAAHKYKIQLLRISALK